MTILFHKPYNTLCRFTDDQGRATLARWIDLPNVYPVGRLDLDSEGLLLLSDEARVVSQLTRPGGHWKGYWAQVERSPDAESLDRLRRGLVLGQEQLKPARAQLIDPPGLPERSVPIRFRRSVPTQWLQLEIQEGKNRQVRRMTAAVGHPCLRLVRFRIGPLELGDLAPGQWRRPTGPEERWLSQL